MGKADYMTSMTLTVFDLVFSSKALTPEYLKLSRFMPFKMLTETEKSGFESILKKLPIAKLISLKDTVTKGRITTKHSYETIQAIISHSGTPKSLLTRQKMGRKYLFQYLTENEIVVPLHSEKELIIDKILEFWKSDLTIIVESDKKQNTASTSKDSAAKVVKKNKKPQKTDGKLGSVKNTERNQQEAKKSPSKIKIEQQLQYIKEKEKALEREQQLQIIREKARELEEKLKQHEEKEKKNVQGKKKVGDKSGEGTQKKKKKLKTDEESNQQNQTIAKEKIKKKKQSVPVNPAISTQTKKRKLKSGEEKGQQNTTIVKKKIKKHNSPKHTTTTTSSQSSALNFNLNVVQGNQSIIDGSTLTLPGPNIPVPVFQTNQSSHPINQPTGDKCMASSSSATDQEFAETFVKWFYKTINSQNPSLDETPEDFGPQHFWNDISLLFTVNSNVEKFDGFEIVPQKLLALAKEELYLFNPNISTEGVRSKKGPLGQLGISVCGMVHQGNVCLGVFEQDFGLALYPSFENHYKIKRIALKLRSSNVATMPKLEEGKDLLAITVV
ncbi:hypothetical protein SNE40_011768 [Patella caerulea]|uniref:Uncharacterized protein n=1 Tax=Patella caerulea TaxID=87958 RepID=A0AAN8PJN6_PATCE